MDLQRIIEIVEKYPNNYQLGGYSKYVLGIQRYR